MSANSPKPKKIVIVAIISFLAFALLLLEGILSDTFRLGWLSISLIFGLYFSFFAGNRKPKNIKTHPSGEPLAANTDGYDLFISFKKSDGNGNNTPDVAMAKNLATALRNRGVKVFFSEDSLEEIGSCRYKADIDEALDSARVMVVVLTKAEYAVSQWVNYEWDSFYNDFLSGVKKNAKLFTYTQGVDVENLPRTLRNVQNFSLETVSEADIVNYITKALSNSLPRPANKENRNV